MKLIVRSVSVWTLTGLVVLLSLISAPGTERRFTYSYEPETMPQGGTEFEQWVTLRTQRAKAVGQQDYNRWEFRSELEYGLTDRYTASLYLNTSATNFRDPIAAKNESEFEFTGVSLENRYMLLNPAEHSIGLALYLEPRYSGEEAELEERLILGQRHGDWKWALNLTHATEWEDHFHETEGELEVSFGLTRDLAKHWSVGLEARDINALPEYKTWEYTAVYLGPVVSFYRENWWATLTVMPQVFGRNYKGEADGHRNLVLDEQERVNVRLIFGVSF